MADAATTLPWSESAEQSLLGCLLVDNDAFSRVACIVDEGAFWHAPHRRIFAAVARLLLAHKPADVVTVFEALRQVGRDEEAGGVYYLNQLAQCVPGASNVRRYAELVADKALRRRIIETAGKLAELASAAETADAALDAGQTLLGGLKRIQASAEPRRMAELLPARIDHWSDLAEGRSEPGIATGFAKFDVALSGGMKPGRVIVIAARTSVGKTSLAQHVLLNAAERGHPGLMLSQEMTAGELVDRAVANLGDVPLAGLSTGRMKDDAWARVTEGSERAARLPVFVDDQPSLTLLDIRAKARDVQRREGLAVLVIDYLQLCAATSSLDKRHHQIEHISRGLKTLAKELDCCILLLSQLNRGAADDEPELHHLKESGAIEEDADVVVLLHPVGDAPEGGKLILAKVAKNRGGPRGRFALALDGTTQRWQQSDGSVERARGGR